MAKPMPAAEVDVSAGLVRRLLAAQHPDLATLPVEFLANGWDNAMYRLGGELLVRLPRRALGAAIIVHEQEWLPRLAPGLPLPVPAPERTGHPAVGYPYPWSVVPYIPGIPAADALGRGDALDMAGIAAAMGGVPGSAARARAARRPGEPVAGRAAGEADRHVRGGTGRCRRRVWCLPGRGPAPVG